MEACGLVVEYNPFHYGHLHHVQEAKKVANADCIIAVMSGSFLQRGEPAIIDKFHRTKAAIDAGVDIVIELPYAYAVQSSALFATGAVKSLANLGITTLCFGSESGKINDFLNAYSAITNQKVRFEAMLHKQLDKGDSFPSASHQAYQAIGLDQIDLMKPNNILGFSYVRAIQELPYNIEPLTIQRVSNNYHEAEIKHPIASATSIRREIMTNGFTDKMASTIPISSLVQLKKYQQTTGFVHDWEKYFPFLHYQVLSKTPEELQNIHGMDEGLEFRLKRTASQAFSFAHWLHLMKTKRYTQTRLQRLFVHLLTNTTKSDIQHFTELPSLPYIRLLGMSQMGQHYLNTYKKHLDAPIYTGLNKRNRDALQLDEKAQHIYYAPLSMQAQQRLRTQEFHLPIKHESRV